MLREMYDAKAREAWQEGKRLGLLRKRNMVMTTKGDTLPPVSVVVLKPFFVKGKRVEAGEVVEVPAEDINDLVARERARVAR